MTQSSAQDRSGLGSHRTRGDPPVADFLAAVPFRSGLSSPPRSVSPTWEAVSKMVELLIVATLIGINGFLSMSELAVVSAKRSRLREHAEQGHAGAQRALELAETPDILLSTIQIGITLVGTVAGVFGGAALAETLAGWLSRIPWSSLAQRSDMIALSMVVLGITFATLVLGELVPKRLALGHPEAIAVRVAPTLGLLARFGEPLVVVLSASTRLVLRMLGQHHPPRQNVTEEDFRHLLHEGTRAGVIEESEQKLIHRVLRLGDRRARQMMTPRGDLCWFDINDPPEAIRAKLAASPHSRFLVARGSLDNLVGVVQSKDLLMSGLMTGDAIPLDNLIESPLLIYGELPALKVLERFRETGAHLAVVLDEFGVVQGIITLGNLLEELVGDLMQYDEEGLPAIAPHPDGWSIDALTPIDEVRNLLALPKETRTDPFHTLGGLVISRLGRLPDVGETVEWYGHRLQVASRVGRRLDRILVSRPSRSTASTPDTSPLPTQSGQGDPCQLDATANTALPQHDQANSNVSTSSETRSTRLSF